MLRKFFLIPALLSVALMLGMADFAEAQRGRGKSRGGGGGRGGGANYSRSYYPGNYYRSYSYSPYYGGYRSSWYPRGWLGYGSSYYSDWYPGYTTYPQTSYYYAPSTTVYVEPPVAVANTAQIRVIVPDPSAQVWFDGNLTRQTGTDRLFHTPALRAGVNFSYLIRASWLEGDNLVTRESTVGVTAGQESIVDFTQTPQ